MTPSAVTFYDYHQPALEDGHYSITVHHMLKIDDQDVSDDITPKSLDFYVEGPRFNLDPSLIHSVYPPVGGKGDYRASLPTLVLNRSTLPWERSPTYGPPDPDYPEPTPKPWLCLLLIDETETLLALEHNNVLLPQTHLADPNLHPPGSAVTDEESNRLPDAINYLELDESLKGLLPVSLKRLQYLSYVRVKEKDPANPLDEPEEQAVLMCNRLPRAGHTSTVYLVSVEENYSNNHPRIFMGKQINNDDNYFFPYLYKWQFHTFDEQLYCVTAAIASNLVGTTIPNLPNLSAIYDQVFDNTDAFETALKPYITDVTAITAIEKAAKIPGSTFHELLSNLKGGFAPFSIGGPPIWQHLANEGQTFSVPAGAWTVRYGAGTQWIYKQVSGSNPCSNAFFGSDPAIGTHKVCEMLAAADVTSTGSVRLNYNQLQKASGTAAWYRGPLAAGPITFPAFPLITRASDLLLTVENDLDTSYAAAWELGRLTALNDVDFSTEFFKWKHEVSTAKRLATLQSNPAYPNIAHLSLTDKGDPNLPLPQHILDKFNTWKNLQGIPYRYLVSDPGLLPTESIRFFQVDVNWVNAFISGAFSIGHTVSADFSVEESNLYLKADAPITGFLISSFAVSGWPDFEVDVTDQNNNPLYPIRKDNLDVNIRLYLYRGQIKQLAFHLHPGKMHPGFLYENGKYIKNGQPILETPQPNPDANNVLHILQTVATVSPGSSSAAGTFSNLISPAQFASQMMEGTPDVVFKIGNL